MGGGFPVGATAFPAEWGPLPAKTHGSTFGGNPVACAAALATIATIRNEGLVERAAVMGERFRQRLQAMTSPLVREIRGLGLMIGVALRIRATPVLRRLMEHGVIALLAGIDVVRFLPPLTIEAEHVDAIALALERALREVAAELGV